MRKAVRIAPNRPAYDILVRYAEPRGKLAYKYEELIKANLPQLCELFVFGFRLLQIEFPYFGSKLIMLSVWALTVCVWIVIGILVSGYASRWLKVNVFCREIDLIKGTNIIDTDLTVFHYVSGIQPSRDLVHTDEIWLRERGFNVQSWSE
jgi:hypothetical protein